MKNHKFYIDVDKANRLGIIGCVNVSLNGRRLKYVIAAKSGLNGFVECIRTPFPVRDGEVLTVKKRGLVKISINKGDC